MDGDNITQIILGIIGTIVPLATLLVSLKTHATNANNHKKQANHSMATQKALDELRADMDTTHQTLLEHLERNDLQTCRIDFRQALKDSPDNIPACLEIARVYFLNLHGNADMGRKFLAWVKEYKVEQWAKRHHEDISNLIEAAKHSA